MTNLTGLTINQRKKALANIGDSNVIVANYDMMVWAYDNRDLFPFRGKRAVVIFDEVNKLKHRTSKRFKAMNNWRSAFCRFVGMTGSPKGNHIKDVWGQAKMVDGGKALGYDFDWWSKCNMYTDQYTGKVVLLPGAAERIHEATNKIAHRIEAPRGAGGTPEIVELPPRYVEMPKKAQELYRELMDKCVSEYMSVNNQTALQVYTKTRQIAQGFIYSTGPDGVRIANQIHDKKIEELKSLVDELNGAQAFIIYQYTEQAELLKQAFPDIGFLAGKGITLKKHKQNKKAWNDGELELLAVHPASAGDGLNLQYSSCGHIIYLTLPESAEHYEQSIGRVARPGNTRAKVMVHNIMARGTQDIARLHALKGKITAQEEMLSAIKGYMV